MQILSHSVHFDASDGLRIRPTTQWTELFEVFAVGLLQKFGLGGDSFPSLLEKQVENLS